MWPKERLSCDDIIFSIILFPLQMVYLFMTKKVYFSYFRPSFFIHSFLSIFQDEWEALSALSPRFKLIPAFSRDQEDKVYVQHLIEAHGEMIQDYINDKVGVVFSFLQISVRSYSFKSGLLALLVGCCIF